MHSPYGAAVHGPWALAIGARLRERFGIDAQAMAGDDGIVIRIPETDAEPPGASLVLFDARRDRRPRHHRGRRLGPVRLPVPRVRGARPAAAATRPRASARRLWQQRQRSAALLDVASKYGSFPIVLEAVRECLQDVYDLPSLLQPDARHRRRGGSGSSRSRPRRRVRSPAHCCSATSPPSSTRATRRWPSARPPRWPSTRRCWASCSAARELRDLLDPAVVEEIELQLQRLADDRKARNAEGVGRPAPPARAADRRRDRRAVPSRAAIAAAWIADLETRPPRSPGPHRRRRVRRRGRGRRPAARRSRRTRAARRARCLHRAGRRSARRPGRPLRPYPRAVHDGRGGAAVRARPSHRPRRAGAARGGRARGGGRVPARRVRQRVVRCRGAAPAAARLAGRCPQGGRAGRAGCTRAASCPPGRTSDRDCVASRACCRWSSSSPVRQFPLRRWSRSSCAPGWSTTGRRCSTS